MSELISVIVPIYNMEQYLEQCLDSIICQTYTDLEIILIDDGSTDSSGEICDRYALQDRRIMVLHQENQGLVMARRMGLSVARGKYVGFVDSDDWIEPEMYEYLYGKIREHQAQVVTSGRFVEKGESKEIPDNMISGVYHPMKDNYFCGHMIFGEDKLIWGITPNFWNKLFEHASIQKWQNAVPSNITYGEDDACVYSCMAYADTVYVSDKCFYHYRVLDTSMSNSSDDDYFTRINLLYSVMKPAFEAHPLSAILLKELGCYMFEFALRGINGLWGLRTDLSIPRHWIDIGPLLSETKIMLYGAGLVGKDYYRQFYFMGLSRNIVWVDRDGKRLREQGLPVYTLEEIDISKIDQVFISVGNEQIVKEIINDLTEMGIGKEKIYWRQPRKILMQELKL